MRTFLAPMESVMQAEDLFKRLLTVLVQGLSRTVKRNNLLGHQSLGGYLKHQKALAAQTENALVWRDFSGPRSSFVRPEVA